jgi:Flp pilus assembly secretin CpaC
VKKLFTLFLLSSFVQPAFAQESGESVMDMPAATTTVEQMDTTHPMMRLSQDKSEMITLKEDAASVIVGNPNHVSVLLDTPRTLVIVPRIAGASHFTVIGKDGSTLMQRHVIVGGPKDNYVRIRRSCDSGDRNCQPTSTYFCPDVCHEVTENNTAPSIPRQ